MLYKYLFVLLISSSIIASQINFVCAENKKGFLSPKAVIDVGINKLPQNFDGDDIDNIVTVLRKIDKKKLVKNKFETKAQYENRLENIVPMIKDIYAFKVDGWYNNGKINRLNLNYNPDKEKLIIEINNYVGVFVVKESIYGDKGKKKRKIEFQIKPLKSHDNELYNKDMKCYFGDCEIEISMKPEIAKINRNNIKLIAICNIVPFYYDDDGYGPYYQEDNRYIPVSVNLVGLWIYNDKTGEIYTKF